MDKPTHHEVQHQNIQGSTQFVLSWCRPVLLGFPFGVKIWFTWLPGCRFSLRGICQAGSQVLSEKHMAVPKRHQKAEPVTQKTGKFWSGFGTRPFLMTKKMMKYNCRSRSKDEKKGNHSDEKKSPKQKSPKQKRLALCLTACDICKAARTLDLSFALPNDLCFGRRLPVALIQSVAGWGCSRILRTQSNILRACGIWCKLLEK